MTVNVTKAALNLREELADLRKPSGIAGEALLRADSVQDARDLIGAGRKNLIINGSFDIWQRGTSTTSYSGSTRGYLADRFAFRYCSNASRSTDVPANEAFKYSLKLDVVSSSDPHMIQGIEGVNRFAGKVVTFSYWIKPTSSVTLRDDYLSAPLGTHSLVANTWQKITNTFTVPAGTIDGEYMYIQFPSNTVATYYITGVQLELGSVATEFEHRSYGEELALCQRYYYRHADHSWTNNNVNVGSAFYYWGDYLMCIVHFPTPMRSPPTLEQGSGSGYFAFQVYGAIDYLNGFSMVDTTNVSCRLYNNSDVSGTGGRAGRVMTDNASAFVAFDAEL